MVFLRRKLIWVPDLRGCPGAPDTDFLVHYGHSCLISIRDCCLPNMMYVFVDPTPDPPSKASWITVSRSGLWVGLKFFITILPLPLLERYYSSVCRLLISPGFPRSGVPRSRSTCPTSSRWSARWSHPAPVIPLTPPPPWPVPPRGPRPPHNGPSDKQPTHPYAIPMHRTPLS